MINIVLIAAMTALLAACAVPVSVQTVRGPDGRTAYVMKCSGMGRDHGDCIAKAGNLCRAGYEVADDNTRFGGALVTGNAVIAANNEYMTVECK